MELKFQSNMELYIKINSLALEQVWNYLSKLGSRLHGKSNVLAKIVIPRLNVTSHYILSELEEKEREEVFRLKRVKQKKDFEKKKDENKRRMATEDGKIDEEEDLAQSAIKPNKPRRSDDNDALQVIKKEDE
ncbi:unnamed protein product [Euphydryas editha]|uniref:Uncharacterized protein n=1 Tax=Euphydryas editha TaxID=104508 RepID=A0AAU9TC46_EUPED|nr:unnamed protein product [Euphydryas editha]